MLLTLIIWALILSSISLYLSGFFVPEIRRKSDIWISGLLFVDGLALAANADAIQGGLLWGQVAGSIALGWLGWQALTLRWQVVPPDLHTPLPDTSGLQAQLQQFWQRVTTPTPAIPAEDADVAAITLEVEATVEEPTEITMRRKSTVPNEMTAPPESCAPELTSPAEASPMIETDPTQLHAVAKELLADNGMP